MTADDRPWIVQMESLAGLGEEDRKRLPVTFEVLDALSGRHVAVSPTDALTLVVRAVAALEERLVRIENLGRDAWIDEQERPTVDTRPRPGPYRRTS